MNSVTPSTTPRISASSRLLSNKVAVSRPRRRSVPPGPDARRRAMDAACRSAATVDRRTAAAGRRAGPGRTAVAAASIQAGCRRRRLALMVAQQQVPALEVGDDRAALARQRRHEAAGRPRRHHLVAGAQQHQRRRLQLRRHRLGLAPSGRPARPRRRYGSRAGRAGRGRARAASGCCPRPALGLPPLTRSAATGGQDRSVGPVGRSAGPGRSRPPGAARISPSTAGACGRASAAIATAAPMLSPST